MKDWSSMTLNESHKNWLTSLAHRYHEALTPEVLSYLEGRALDQDAVRGALLGLVSDPDPAHEPYRGRLSIPYITPTGVVYMRFRCLEKHDCKEAGCAKYLGDTSTTHLYNVQALHDATVEIGVAEGELDALVSTVSGLPAVGCAGASSWKPFYYRLFDDFERVYVLGDGDSAGRKWATTLSPHIPGATPKVMPVGHDVTSYVVEHGAEEFIKLIHGNVQP
jgi:DNA primase